MNDFAIVTCLFTVSSHPLRSANFATFDADLADRPYVAEVCFEQSSRVSKEGPRTFVLRGERQHRLWQKERLLNLVIERLPPEIAYVAWVDADVLFSERNWISAARALLQKYSVIQLFDRVVHLDCNGFPLWQGVGVAASLPTADAGIPFERKGASGFAWAARRDLLHALRLMDFMIVGGADSYMAQGFMNIDPTPGLGRVPRATQKRIVAWHKEAAKATQGRVGFLPGTIEHLYHGHLVTRKYLQRYELLRAAEFDPTRDIAIDAAGLYAWNSPKHRLHTSVAEYFQQRSIDENG